MPRPISSSRFAQVSISVGLALATCGQASAQFLVFEGDSTVEAAWRAAALAQPGDALQSEDFEGFSGVGSPFAGPSDQVITLPALGVRFASDVVDAYPGVYSDSSFAHSGVNQLANFGGGLAQFADYRILPIDGRRLFALGFWQCDPQGDQRLFAFDAGGELLGTIVGAINNGSGRSFAGFVSSVAVARVAVEGSLGDGWNHIDDLQVVTRSACIGSPCPDLDCDGDVDLVDLATLLTNFGTPSDAGRDQGDLDSDADVDLTDLATLLANFGVTCEG